MALVRVLPGSLVQVPSVPNGVVVVTHKTGTTTTYAPSADTDAARGTALISAAAALTAYDVAMLSGGTFALGNNYLTLPASTELKGSGAGQTTITSSSDNGGGAGGTVSLNSNCRVESLTLSSTSNQAAPLGLAVNTGVTNFVVSDCIIAGVVDGIYNTIGNSNIGRFYNTKFTSTYDAVNWTRGTLELFDCDIVVTGPSNTDPGRGVVAGGAGTVYFYGGSVTVNGSTSENVAFEATSGTIEAHNVRTNVGTSATNNWDINGVVRYNNVTRTDGAALVINGASSFRLSRNASRDNNLSDLASASTARTNLGLAIGTNVQAYDADLTTWAGITPGTGVGTALAVNVGSAGAFVTNVGTTTNDSAAAGGIGEIQSSIVDNAHTVSLSNGTAADVTFKSLTAGDWDVEGNVNFTETTSTVTARSAGISTTSATLPTDGSEAYCGVQSTVTSETNTITLPRKRISIASTTTVYLVGKATFSAGTCAGFGAITARRVR